ncbi:hypothetical protein ACQ4PT_018676 [Festuca glaucescens]
MRVYPHEDEDESEGPQVPSASGTIASEEEEGDGDEEGEEEEHEEEGDEEVPSSHGSGKPKPLWIRGPAALPSPPKNEDEKTRIKVTKKDMLGLFGTTGRRPGGMLTCILKKYWPGLYKVSPNAILKLTLKWEDYEVALCGTFATTNGRVLVPTCAIIVLKMFWDYYVVDAAHQEEATRVLVVMAKKKVRGFLYHAKKEAISHFYAETRGVMKNKDKVIGEDLSIKAAEFASVTANAGKPVPEVLAWQKAHKKKEVVPGTDPYYGTTSYDLEQYTIAIKKLHGKDSDPLSEPLDETAVMISRDGGRHGRLRILDAVVKPTTTLTRVTPRNWSCTDTDEIIRDLCPEGWMGMH